MWCERVHGTRLSAGLGGGGCGMNAPDLPASALPLVLMSLAGPLGALDIVYFHLWKFRLYSLPSARAETVTHLLRGIAFAAGGYLLATYSVSGAWFWLVGGLFAFDFFNNVVDAALETRSRAALGGLPRAEYVVHIIGSTFAGAIMVAFFVTSWASQSGPTKLASSRGTLPDWLILNGQMLAAGAALLTVIELCLFLHARTARRRIAAIAAPA